MRFKIFYFANVFFCTVGDITLLFSFYKANVANM